MHVSVWWATPRDVESLDGLLDDADRTHLAWLRSDRARSESATSRALLRAVLGRSGGSGGSGGAVAITRRCPDCDRPHGRPLVAGRHVSTSHTEGLVAVAVADAPVGIDVELASPERFAGLQFDAVEWTRREAYLKALGGGLRTDPASVTPRDTADLDLGNGYAAAVCVHGGRPVAEITAADAVLTAWAGAARTATA